MIVEYIQSALLLIAAFLVIVSAVGLVSLSKGTKNAVYARIHIVGVFDVACIIAMIGLGQYLLAGIYFILAPFILNPRLKNWMRTFQKSLKPMTVSHFQL